ncbi:MAG: YceI family protein [Pseudomonadota bacterium]
MLQEAVLADASYSAAAIQYRLDREATQIGFSVGDTNGRFRVVDARLGFTDPDVTTAQLEVTIATASLDLFNPLIEGMLKGADWFDVSAHPQARFETDEVVVQSDQSLAIAGSLTIKAITQPLNLIVRFPESPRIPSLLAPAPDRIAFEASGTFLRSAFGMDDLMSFAPDDVALLITGELIRVAPGS